MSATKVQLSAKVHNQSARLEIQLSQRLSWQCFLTLV